LANPYYIADEVGLTQTAGWLDGWTSQPSVSAVTAETAGDVVAAGLFIVHHGVGSKEWSGDGFTRLAKP
jgi:hypothetical protein